MIAWLLNLLLMLVRSYDFFKNFSCPDFPESCGNMQYLLRDGVLYISSMILQNKMIFLGMVAYTKTTPFDCSNPAHDNMCISFDTF